MSYNHEDEQKFVESSEKVQVDFIAKLQQFCEQEYKKYCEQFDCKTILPRQHVIINRMLFAQLDFVAWGFALIKEKALMLDVASQSYDAHSEFITQNADEITEKVSNYIKGVE